MWEVCCITPSSLPSTVNGTPNNWKEWHGTYLHECYRCCKSVRALIYCRFCSLITWTGKMIASEHAAIHYLKRQASDRASSIHTFLSGHGVDLWAACVYTAAPCRAAYPRERKRPKQHNDTVQWQRDCFWCLLVTVLKACLPDLKTKWHPRKSVKVYSASTYVIHLNQEKHIYTFILLNVFEYPDLSPKLLVCHKYIW